MRQSQSHCPLVKFKKELNVHFNLFLQVLKALALIRLGRPDEAQVILKEVQKEEPYEDATLQAMAICFRETHQRKSII